MTEPRIGNLISCRREALISRVHVDSDLVLASQESLEHCLELRRLGLDACDDLMKVVLSPLSAVARPNRGDPSIFNFMISGLERVRKIRTVWVTAKSVT
jgi:hypothetical protein